MENGGEVRVVIFTGAGEKAFIAGADIGELKRLDVVKGEKCLSKPRFSFRAD